MVSDACTCVFYLPSAMGQMSGEDSNGVPRAKNKEEPSPTCVDKPEATPATPAQDEI